MKTRQCFSLMRTCQMLLLLALLPVYATAQDAYFYTFEGERIMLDKAADQIVVKIAQLEERAAVESELQKLIPDMELKPVKGIHSESFFIIRSQSDISATLIQLKERPQFDKVQPVYLLNGSPLIPYDVFTIKLQNDAEFNRMMALNERYGVELVRRNAQLPNLITLKMIDFTEFTVLELAQQYFHELNLKYSTPSFIREMERHGPVQDPYFVYQFYMHMTSAELAWQITKASSNITVAVLDDGVMAHEDLSGSRIVNGYDAFNPINGDGSPGGNEAHGMASAGIIAHHIIRLVLPAWHQTYM